MYWEPISHLRLAWALNTLPREHRVCVPLLAGVRAVARKFFNVTGLGRHS